MLSGGLIVILHLVKHVYIPNLQGVNILFFDEDISCFVCHNLSVKLKAADMEGKVTFTPKKLHGR